jgi:hypothetical protein
MNDAISQLKRSAASFVRELLKRKAGMAFQSLRSWGVLSISSGVFSPSRQARRSRARSKQLLPREFRQLSPANLAFRCDPDRRSPVVLTFPLHSFAGFALSAQVRRSRAVLLNPARQRYFLAAAPLAMALVFFFASFLRADFSFLRRMFLLVVALLTLGMAVSFQGNLVLLLACFSRSAARFCSLLMRVRHSFCLRFGPPPGLRAACPANSASPVFRF